MPQHLFLISRYIIATGKEKLSQLTSHADTGAGSVGLW